MPLSTVLIGLEFFNIASIWFADSSIDLAAKMCLTVAFVATYICSTIMFGTEKPVLFNTMLVASALLNCGVIAFSVVTRSWLLLINNAFILVFLTVWTMFAVFGNIRIRREKE